MVTRKKVIRIKVMNDRVKEKRYAYDLGSKNFKTELVCRYCSAIYQDKHWKSFNKLNPSMIDKIKKAVCPTCHEKRSLVSDGILHITGTFMNIHQKEILGIIVNAEAKEVRRDIMNRIERIEIRPKEITVYTSKNQLAVEIGKKIASAYKGGDLKIKWSKGDKPADVTWHKDNINKLT